MWSFFERIRQTKIPLIYYLTFHFTKHILLDIEQLLLI